MTAQDTDTTVDFDDLTEEQEDEMAEVLAEMCRQIADATGMTPAEVYEHQFERRPWSFVVTTHSDGTTTYNVEFEDADSAE